MNRLSEPLQKILEEENKKGNIQIDNSREAVYFITFGALGVLLNADPADEAKEERIKEYIFKVLGYSD